MRAGPGSGKSVCVCAVCMCVCRIVNSENSTHILHGELQGVACFPITMYMSVRAKAQDAMITVGGGSDH